MSSTSIYTYIKNKQRQQQCITEKEKKPDSRNKAHIVLIF
jgi:hypothetical protein